MDLHQVRFALLKISVVVLAASSWVFSSFVFESRPPEDEEAMELSGIARPVDEMMKSLVRLPASIPSQLPGVVPSVLTGTSKGYTPVRMDTVDLSCWDKPGGSGTRSAGARWVRLTGKTCVSEKPAGDEEDDADEDSPKGSETITVSNLSNGYVATVFDAAVGLLTTDFIPLDQGKNEILIRFDHGRGAAVENRFVLNR